MEQQTGSAPTAKIVAFVAFGVLLALGVFFLVGLVEFYGQETYGIARVIDEIKLITGDLSAYIKGMIETVKLNLELISNDGGGIAALFMIILDLIFPVMSILCFFMVVLHLALSWIPFVRIEELGWNKVCRRISKRLKKVLGWALGFIIYAFVIYGKPSVDLTVIGNVALWMVVAYAVARVLIDGFGGKDTILHTVLSAVLTAVIAVFLVIVLRHFLLREGSLLYIFLSYIESVITTKNSDLRTVHALLAGYVLCLYISMQIAAKAMEKQIVKRSNGLKASLICLFVFLVIAAALHFVALKKVYDGLSFSDWMDAEESKMIIRSVIYGVIGLVLAIVTPIVGRIGIPQQHPQTPDEETSI